MDKDIIKYFPKSIVEIFLGISEKDFKLINEINITIGQPLMVRISGTNLFASKNGLSRLPDMGILVKKEHIDLIFGSITNSSAYAYNRFINDGFLTLEGGHRVGVVGECVINDDKVVNVCNINSLCFRIARDIPSKTDLVFDDIYNNGDIKNTIIISPPGCGKTTFLRSIAREFSNSNTTRKILKCAIIDERFEIAACKSGIATMNVGLSAVVISGCKKSIAIPMVVRSMTPDIILTDELATCDDINAVKYAKSSGCKVIATTHGKDELYNELKHLNPVDLFDILIVLSSRNGPGTVEKVTRSSI